MIYFIGAGPGATDLITVRGLALLKRADMVVYAGSLVNPALLSSCPPGCEVLDSARMTLPEVVAALARGDGPGKVVVRLHTGDPCLYGAIREQMEALRVLVLPFEIVPGVSAFSAAAAALEAEYTLPGVSQTVIITRRAGRTPVPERESVRALAAHRATMVFFLSTGMLKDLCADLIAGGYPADTPAALVFKASWPEQQTVRGTLRTLPGLAAGFEKTALITVGDFLGDAYAPSKLYDPSFSHGFREAAE